MASGIDFECLGVFADGFVRLIDGNEFAREFKMRLPKIRTDLDGAAIIFNRLGMPVEFAQHPAGVTNIGRILRADA